MPKLSAGEPFVHPGCEIVETSFGAFCEVGAGSRIQNTSFGDYSYCDRLAQIANATIGKFANIAALARIGPTDHPIGHAALHHFHYRSAWYWPEEADDAAFFAARAARRVVLGHDTWIGHAAIVRPEVSVGHGAIVAAGAVVTRDVAPFTIVAGCPAVKLRDRFAPGVGERLAALGWWDWDHERLRLALPDFRTLKAEAFLEKYGC